MKKGLAAAALAAVLALGGLAGCGGGRPTITLAHWANSLAHERAYEQIAEQYNKLQSDVRVKVVKKQADNYRTWLLTQLSGGKVPDIVQTTALWADVDAKNGYMENLSPHLDEINPYTGTVWRESFNSGFLKITEDKFTPGRWNCVPTSTVSIRFYLNTGMFAKYGVPLPDKNWTWEDFLNISRAFKEKKINPMLVPNAKMTDYVVSWALDIITAQILEDQIAGWDIDGSGKIDTNEIVRAVLTGELDFNAPRVKEGMEIIKAWSAYWQDGAASTTTSNAYDAFARQESPMFFNGSWTLKGIEMTLANENPESTEKFEKFDFIVLPFPKVTLDTTPNADMTMLVHDMGDPSFIFGIPTVTQKRGTKQYALDFFRYLTAPENAQILADNAYDISVINGVTTSDNLKDFLPDPAAKIVKMRWSGQTLSDGTLEDFCFKQQQLYLIGDIDIDRYGSLIQSKYESVCRELAEENGWNSGNNWGSVTV